MYYVQLLPTNRILGSFLDYSLRGIFEEEELQIIVYSTDEDIRTVSSVFQPNERGYFDESMFLDHEFPLFLFPIDDQGIVEQMTFDALNKALVPTQFKEYGMGSLELSVKTQDTLANEYADLIENEDPLLFPPEIPFDLGVLDYLVQFYLLPQRKQNFIQKYLREAFSGDLYKKNPGNYYTNFFLNLGQIEWNDDANKIVVVSDDNGEIHHFNSSCIDPRETYYKMLQISRMQSDSLVFGKGLILHPGMYPVYPEHLGMLHLDVPELNYACKICLPYFHEGRWMSKK